MVLLRFTKIFSIAMVVAFLASSVESTNHCPDTPDNINSGKKQTFVVLLEKKEGATKKHFATLESCWDKRVERVVPNSEKKSKKSKDDNVLLSFSVEGSIQGYSGRFTTAFAKMLSKMDNVALVEKEQKFEIKFAIPQNLTRRAVDNDPEKNLDRIDQAKRPLDGKFIFPDSAGKGVNIFVVDTGIRITHNEFENRAKVGGSFCDGCNDDDENGHGTQVASIAAGKTFGVARKSNLVAVRVLDAKGAGNNVDVINGLAFVLDQHKSGKSKNTVVNMSLGGGFSDAVNTAVKDLTDAGVHVAVAAGNEAQDACKTSPASELFAVTVGATQEDDETIADFSNFGKCVDLFAPGSNINGAGIQNDDDVIAFSGTSQATPHVAGTLALMIAKDGNKSPADLSNDLLDLSTKDVVEGLDDADPSGDSPNTFLRTPEP